MNAAPRTLHARLLAAALGLAALHAVLLAAAFRFNNADDAYIAFRYGRNLMQGHGLVFNAGERVEGYTSLLWTLLLAPCTVLPVDVAWCSIALGLAAGLATLWGLSRLVRQAGAAGGGPWLGAVILTLAPEVFRFVSDYRMLVYGGLLVLMMRFQPQGLVGDDSFLQQAWAAVRGRGKEGSRHV